MIDQIGDAISDVITSLRGASYKDGIIVTTVLWGITVSGVAIRLATTQNIELLIKNANDIEYIPVDQCVFVEQTGFNRLVVRTLWAQQNRTINVAFEYGKDVNLKNSFNQLVDDCRLLKNAEGFVP